MAQFQFMLVASVLISLSLGENCFDFSAFNIQILGRTKMSKPDVVHSLVKILGLYDVVVIQEIRDSYQTAFLDLFNKTAADNPVYADKLAYFTGPRLGRSSSKEQYGFIYRQDKVTLIEHVTYPDNDTQNYDVFAREPEIALFEMVGCSNGTQNMTFMVIVCHVDPDEVVAETDALVDAYEWAANYFGVQDAIITGDFNADCSYMAGYKRAASELLHDPTNPPRFISLFDDDADTNVATSSCAYDRMILTGTDINNAVSSSYTRVYLFDDELGLNYTEAKKVSDHYPIQSRFCCPY